jgi:hypothetical protein
MAGVFEWEGTGLGLQTVFLHVYIPVLMILYSHDVSVGQEARSDARKLESSTICHEQAVASSFERSPIRVAFEE